MGYTCLTIIILQVGRDLELFYEVSYISGEEQPQRQERFIASTFCLTSVLQQFKDAASSPQTKWLPRGSFLNPAFSFALACVFSYPRQALQSPFLFPYPYESTLFPSGLSIHTPLFFSSFFLFFFFSIVLTVFSLVCISRFLPHLLLLSRSSSCYS